jgi:hypothetical protein
MSTLTLLHDPNNAASVAFLALWGTTGPVITGHDASVAAYPAIQGYPTVVYQDASGNNHFLFNPADMAAVTAWETAIKTPSQAQPVYVSKIDFNNRFEASERQAVLLAIRNGDVVLEDANNTLSLTTDPPGVNLNDTNLQSWANYLVNDVKILTAERANAILAGSSITISATTASNAAPASNAGTGGTTTNQEGS